MASSTVENYIKTLYMLQQEWPEALVPMGKFAAAMHVTPGTATTMVKTLEDAELVQYRPRSGVRLSQAGEKLALHVLRRHRLIELLLVEIIGLDWSEVHAEAERLEHAVSDLVVDKIDELLEFPSVDPHGDPIPNAAGKIAYSARRALSECTPGTEGTVVRVMDQDPAFLQFLDKKGLKPGTLFSVTECDKHGDSITLDTTARQGITLGSKAAEKIFVQ